MAKMSSPQKRWQKSPYKIKDGKNMSHHQKSRIVKKDDKNVVNSAKTD